MAYAIHTICTSGLSPNETMRAHVLVDDLTDGQHIVRALQGLLGTRFGIEHTTIQLESHRSPLLKINPGLEPNHDSLEM
jgi:Co/Zn/Cd efflux system component